MTLEELYMGNVKAITLKKKLYDAGSGQYLETERTFEVSIVPGMRDGEKITYVKTFSVYYIPFAFTNSMLF